MEGFVNQLRKATRQVEVRDFVIYTDELRLDHNAMITCVHGESYAVEQNGEEFDQHPCVNLVFVVGDESKVDDYGRQIERYTSVTHSRQQTGGGFCWRFPDEEKPTRQPVRR